MSLNHCQFIGRLTVDPRVNLTKGGTLKRALFSIAVENHWRDKDGHKASHVEFVDLIAWGNMAIVAEKFLRKGARIFVDGRFETSKWVDQVTGQKKRKSQVVVKSIQFLDKHKKKKKPEEAEEPEDEEVNTDG